MDAETKAYVNDEVQRLFKEDIATHRQFLEQTFTQVKWGVVLIITLIGLGGLFLFGDSAREVMQEYRTSIKSEVEKFGIKQAFSETIEKKIEEEFTNSAKKIMEADSKEQKKKFSVELGKILEAQTDSVISKSVKKRVDQISANDLKLSLMPAGAIIAFDPKRKIPQGWALCNGQNGTPDLRNRFIYGATDEASDGSKGGKADHLHSVKVGLAAGPARGSDWRWGDTPWANANPPALSGSATGNTAKQNHMPPYMKLMFIMKL